MGADNMILRWLNKEKDMLFIEYDDGRKSAIGNGNADWLAFSARQDIEPYVAPAPPSAESLRQAMQLTFAQLLIGLVAEGWITRAEGEAWLNGTLPLPVTQIIATLPDSQQFAAIARAKLPSVIMRLDGLVMVLAATQGRSDAQMDAFFTTYAAI